MMRSIAPASPSRAARRRRVTSPVHASADATCMGQIPRWRGDDKLWGGEGAGKREGGSGQPPRDDSPSTLSKRLLRSAADLIPALVPQLVGALVHDHVAGGHERVRGARSDRR